MEDRHAQSETAARDSDQHSVAREPGVGSDSGVPDYAEPRPPSSVIFFPKGCAPADFFPVSGHDF